MSKAVDRAQVLNQIKVKNAMHRDDSWIHKKGEDTEEDQSRKEPARLTKQNSYVFLTAKKFEHQAPVEKDLQDSKMVHTSPTTETPIDDSQTEPTSAKQDEQHVVQYFVQSDKEPTADMSADAHIEDLATEPTEDNTQDPTELQVGPETECEDNPVLGQAEEIEQETEDDAQEPLELQVGPETECEDNPVLGQAEEIEQETEDDAQEPTELQVGPETEYEDNPVLGQAEETEQGTEDDAQEPTELQVGPETECEDNPVLGQAEETEQGTEDDAQEPTELQVGPETECEDDPVLGQAEEAEQEVNSNVEEVTKIATAEHLEGSDEVVPVTDLVTEQTVQSVVSVAVKSLGDSAAENDSSGENLQDASVIEPLPELLTSSTSQSPIGLSAEKADQCLESTGGSVQSEPVLGPETMDVAESENKSVSQGDVEKTSGDELNHTKELDVDISTNPVTESTDQPATDQNNAITAKTAGAEAAGESATLHPLEEDSVTAVHPSSEILFENNEITLEPATQATEEPVGEKNTEATPENLINDMEETKPEVAVKHESASSIETAAEIISQSTPEANDLSLKNEPQADTATAEIGSKLSDVNIKDEVVGSATEPTETTDAMASLAEGEPAPVEVIQQPDGNKVAVGDSTCTYCNTIINGNVRIRINHPPTVCHPDCLKCAICACALGDMLTPMFLHGQGVHCGSCFSDLILGSS